MLTAALAAEPRDRFAFAEMYLGGDVRLVGGDLDSETAAGASSGLSGWWSASPRLWVGATHFWGHADFYVAFAVPPTFGSSVAPSGGLLWQQLYQSVETGGRYYPLALRPDTIRPWVGAGWVPLGYRQEDPEQGLGPLISGHSVQLGAGVSARVGDHTVELGVGVLPVRLDYPVSPARTVPFRANPATASVGYRYNFDTTRSARRFIDSGDGAAYLSRLEAAGTLSAWSLAAGPSSAFTLGADDGPLTYAGGPSSALFADVAVGRYFHDLDGAVRLSWRRIAQRARGYGAERAWQRQAVSVEAFKMLFDYQGFVPFIGPGLGVNWLSYAADGQEDTGLKVSPEVVFGWDIRPTRTQGFLLRTNLRYAPLLELDVPGGRFQHLEFNFIQLVVYPGRMRTP